ncbi:TolC family protein [Massilia terrae]|uniref:TolC family protein n=1 Tax=Massilia terrae TaxID=1811224 RepID=A0ABT2CZB4_9BURK|nr:TolC family protein [Massilia terrae]MCS0659321.1 TolC family protein [Massilia terrae]
MRCSWIFAFCLLTGCAAYQPKPLDPARLAQRFDQRSLADPALRVYIERESGRPLPVQWDAHMLALAAGFYNPALAIAQAQQQAAQGSLETAGARPNPTLAFPFEYELNHHDGGHPYTTGPALSWPIETAGKRPARIALAQAQADAVRMNTLGTAWKIRSQVRAAFRAVFVATLSGELLAARVDWARRSVELLQHRLQAGAVGAPDLRRQQLVLAQAESERSSNRIALASARAQLATAIGVPVAALDAVKLDFGELAHPVLAPAPADARRAAIEHRADLRAALADYEAGQAALRLEIAKQYPDVQIGAGYTYDVGANKISFGLGGVTLPLFDRNQGGIAQAEAKRSELAARVEALQEAVLNELDNSSVRYRESRAAAERAALQLATAGRQRDAAQASFATGGADRLELSQAQLDYESHAIAYLNAVAAMQDAAAQLEDAIQQPLPPDAVALNLTPSGSAP